MGSSTATSGAPPAPAYQIVRNEKAHHKGLPNRDTTLKITFAVAFFFGFVILATAGVGHIGVLGSSGLVTELTTLGAITTKVASALAMTPHGICLFGEVVAASVMSGSAIALILIQLQKRTLKKSVVRLEGELGYAVDSKAAGALTRDDLKINFNHLKAEFLNQKLGKGIEDTTTLTQKQLDTLAEEFQEATLQEVLDRLPDDTAVDIKSGMKYKQKVSQLVENAKKGEHYDIITRHGITLYVTDARKTLEASSPTAPINAEDSSSEAKETSMEKGEPEVSDASSSSEEETSSSSEESKQSGIDSNTPKIEEVD